MDIHARDHVTEARMAFDADGRITAVEAEIIANLGAYQSQFAACIPSLFCVTMFSGQYAIPALHCRVLGVYTNTTPIDAYRGAGNPEITYVIERLIENGARERGADSVEARALNLVPADRMPYASATGVTYDVGDFPAVLEKARALADLDALRAEQVRFRADGALMGIGMAAFVRSGGAGPSRLRGCPRQPDGSLGRRHRAGPPQRQDHGALRQSQPRPVPRHDLRADRRRPLTAARSRTSISWRAIRTGFPTALAPGPHARSRWWARRSPVASDRIIDKGRRLAAHLMECAVDDIDFGAGAYAVRGTDRRMTFVEIAGMAYRGADYPEGFELGLEEAAFFDPDDFNYPYGTHVRQRSWSKIPKPAVVRLTAYYSVEDTGLVINPLVVDGQRHGAAAQGIGQALLEDVRYEPASGQLLTGSFMDYTMPRADGPARHRAREPRDADEDQIPSA